MDLLNRIIKEFSLINQKNNKFNWLKISFNFNFSGYDDNEVLGCILEFENIYTGPDTKYYNICCDKIKNGKKEFYVISDITKRNRKNIFEVNPNQQIDAPENDFEYLLRGLVGQKIEINMDIKVK